MKHLKKLRFRESAVLLIVGVFLGLLFVQQVFVNTTEAQQNTKKFNPVTDQLKGSTMSPADVKELEKGKAPPKEAKRELPTMKTLMDKVSKQPGGKEKIKRATIKGKTSGKGSEMTGILLSGLSELNPFKVEVAHAQSFLTIYCYSPYKKLSDTFWGYFILYGVKRGYGSNSSSLERLVPGIATFGADIRRPALDLKVRVPSSGWYVINVETIYGAKGTLKTYQSGSFVTLQNFDSLSTPETWKDHPALLNLSAGYHQFYWILEQGAPYIYRVTVQKY